ncbi:MAG: GTPase Era [Rhodospirillales bacterium]|nr:GTPase Era [Rhodospirillales bacterium]
MADTSPTKSGFVAIVGAPNVGKSTLLNRFVGAKVSIVSPKVQTTRSRVLGICIEGASQVIFIDTPGIFAPRRRLDRAMVAAAWGGAGDADEVLFLVDASRRICKDTAAILDRLKATDRKVYLAINKVDLVKKEDLLTLIDELTKRATFSEIFMVSAETGDGADELLAFLANLLPDGPWLFPEDQISDMPQRLLAAEITREKIFLQLRQELPYAATVETEKWETRPDGSVKIDQTIYVERPTQKAIVLGKGGAQIKALGEASRRELEKLLDTRIHLFLFVKVREKWGDDPERYRDWGLDYNA